MVATSSSRVHASGRPRIRRSPPAAIQSWLESAAWTESAYFALPDTNHYVELSDESLVIPEMPTVQHQRVVKAFAAQLDVWIAAHEQGEVIVGPYPVRLWAGKIREPDVLFYRAEHLDRIHDQFGDPPDLVLEVLSPGTRTTDLKEKLAEYEQAGVGEYWIADPGAPSVEVRALVDGKYLHQGPFVPGQRATSTLLPGYVVDVDTLFRPARR